MFHKIALSADEVSTGLLMHIGDALSDAFVESAKAGRKYSNNPTELLVYFENSAVNPKFNEEYGDDVFDVLYFNDAALLVAQKAGFELSVLETAHEPPKFCGLMTRMYIF